MKRKPSVAILTALTDFSPSYSLVPVILEQARTLKRHGYPYTLFCLQYFNQTDKEIQDKEGLNISYTLPKTLLHNYKLDEPPKETDHAKKILGFRDQADVHFAGDSEQIGTFGYKKVLELYDVIITHDLMFIDSHLVQNAAIRKCIELWPEKQWLHWIHSSPSHPAGNLCFPSELRFSAAPNSTYVFLNDGYRHNCALMLQTTRDNVATVYNSRDIRDLFGFSEDTQRVIDRYNLMDHQLLQVYPISSPRWDSKGVKALIRIFKHFRDIRVKAKLVIVNANCNSPGDIQHVEAMRSYLLSWGIKPGCEVILTSDFAQERADRLLKQDKKNEAAEALKWKYTVPYRVVRELMQLSNLFIFPSHSECCSLIQAEASVMGKFVVLNRNFSPMLEFGHASTLHYELTANNPDARDSEYYYHVAREIWAEVQTESAVMNRTKAVTQTYNRDWIFQKQLEPLLWKKATRQEFKGELFKEPKVAVVVKGGEAVDRAVFEDPQPGMACPIFGECSEEQKDACYKEAGHCLNLDQVTV
jgi:glycosyltransferase involved in cell wall biosynthesis